MDALTETLMKSLSGGGLSQIGQVLGTDEKATGSALSAVVPLLVSALATEASKPEGARALHHAIEEDHDGSVLGQLQTYLTTDPAKTDGPGILRHALGGSRPVVEQGLAKKTGLDAGQIGTLLEIAAPLVMGALGAQQRSKGLDTDGLASLLGTQRQTAAKEDPDLLGILNTALDADRDGSAVDDVIGFVGKLFGKRG